MTCDEIDELLHGYMDGELDAVTSRNVEDHLATCTSCTRELASFRDLRSSLRQNGLYHRSPATLERNVRREARKGGESIPVFRRGVFAIAAAILIACLAVWGVGRTRSHAVDPMIALIVDDHVRSLMADHLVDVKSSDKHTVKPWFDGKLDFAPPVQRLDGTQFPLIGGRLDYVNGHPAAAVVYRHNKHIINLLIWPAAGPDTAPAASSDRGYNVVHWTNQGMTYWAASDVSAPDLATFAGLIRSAQ
jgi:anti-sigma factor RsiW